MNLCAGCARTGSGPAERPEQVREPALEVCRVAHAGDRPDRDVEEVVVRRAEFARYAEATGTHRQVLAMLSGVTR